MNALVVEDVVKTFGRARASTRAVDDLSFEVPSGSICGFLGPNGAGKTTTIRMTMDIIRPDAGRIRLLDGAGPREARHRVGYMPEERGLYPKMSVGRVLSYLGRVKGIPTPALNKRIDYWLERVGLSNCAGKKVEELSRGMQQKIQFIAAVIHDPVLLILDEPFASLDPINADLLKTIILGMKAEGKTVIFSTHVMEQAEQLCDYIVLIDKGRNVLSGLWEEIRAGHPVDSVEMEVEGDAAFVETLPMVREVSRNGNTLHIRLQPGADEQQLLGHLVGRVRLLRFELSVPSLHQIFVQRVGESHE